MSEHKCPVVHFSNVTTVGECQSRKIFHSSKIFYIVAAPSWVTMSVSGDKEQPFASGSKIVVTCSSGGGKPFPAFRWSLAGEEVSDHEETVVDEATISSEISFEVEEEHDGALIECW